MFFLLFDYGLLCLRSDAYLFEILPERPTLSSSGVLPVFQFLRAGLGDQRVDTFLQFISSGRMIVVLVICRSAVVMFHQGLPRQRDCGGQERLNDEGVALFRAAAIAPAEHAIPNAAPAPSTAP